MTSNGIELIAAERKRQVESECWTSEHDDLHDKAEMAHAAESYLLAASYVQDLHVPSQMANLKSKPPRFWPWDKLWWRPSEDPIRNLVKAGALIAAEIDRLQRTKKPEVSIE